MTPLQELIRQLKDEKHRYMMQEHHPLELYLIYSCFESAILKVKDLLEKERKVIIEAYEKGSDNAHDWHSDPRGGNLSAEEYLKETYQNK
tara:strand:- start:420 stop:689 length:270 start_codon:yes stop_codon:yes gene_type:complete